MTLNNKKRFIVMSATAVALTLSFARCSPLNSSIDKSLLRPRQDSDLMALKQQGRTSQPLVASDSHIKKATDFKTKVLDVSAFSDLRAQFEESKSQVIELTRSQVSDLRELRRTAVSLGEETPAEATIYINVSLPRAIIVRTEIESFTAEMRHLADGSWELSIPRRSDPDRDRSDESILSSLEGVMISVQSSKAEEKSTPKKATPSIEEGEEDHEPKKPVRKPLGLEPRIHSVNAIRSLETSRHLLRLISSSQAL